MWKLPTLEAGQNRDKQRDGAKRPAQKSNQYDNQTVLLQSDGSGDEKNRPRLYRLQGGLKINKEEDVYEVLRHALYTRNRLEQPPCQEAKIARDIDLEKREVMKEMHKIIWG